MCSKKKSALLVQWPIKLNVYANVTQRTEKPKVVYAQWDRQWSRYYLAINWQGRLRGRGRKKRDDRICRRREVGLSRSTRSRVKKFREIYNRWRWQSRRRDIIGRSERNTLSTKINKINGTNQIYARRVVETRNRGSRCVKQQKVTCEEAVESCSQER